MGRRSYLSRVAQPLGPGDPVIASIPRAPPEESRQAISPVFGPSASLQRLPSSATNARAANPLPGPKRASLSEAARQGTVRPAIHSPANQTSPSLPTTRSRGAREEPSFAGTVVEAAPSPAKAVPVEVVSAPSAASDVTDAPHPSAIELRRRRSNARAVDPPVQLAESGQSIPPFISPPKQEPPRLHIGAIEVRVAQPAPTNPPPVAPIFPVGGTVGRAPAAAPSISAPYASRFGLAQG
jgi:hypothetical protein